jgi:hypothetical protein
MAGKKVTLDAMIKRADFAQQAEAPAIELGEKLIIEQISSKSPFLRFLRKPDFQRETNHWSPEQVATLVKSFASGELIPSLILWKSSAYVFVIDGAHRLSALKAWVENDYGDGTESFKFFGGKISTQQKRHADATRKLVEKAVGRFSDFKSMSGDDLEADTAAAKTAATIFTRSLHIQWIQGSQEVAESSFFKINSQGTALDLVEEMLLKNRKTSYAIAARSVVRAGTGHKYWSGFSKEAQKNIEDAALRLNNLLFQPDVTEPIKTLDLPLGGTSSSIDALKMLIDIFSIMDGSVDSRKSIEALAPDVDGTQSLALLRRAQRVAGRLTGNDAPSLGLHPAVYFYTERGKHSRFLFLGVFKAVADSVRNNNSKWFQDFSRARKALEKMLVERKSLVNQGLANINSNQRIDRVANLLRELVTTLGDGKKVGDQQILTYLGLAGKAGNLRIIDAPRGFSDDTKSAIFLQDALKVAVRCSICGGYLDASRRFPTTISNPDARVAKGHWTMPSFPIHSVTRGSKASTPTPPPAS